MTKISSAGRKTPVLRHAIEFLSPAGKCTGLKFPDIGGIARLTMGAPGGA
jgi:hypothetical protein